MKLPNPYPQNNDKEQVSLEKEYINIKYKQKYHYALKICNRSLHRSISKWRYVNRFLIVTEEESAKKRSENNSTLSDFGHRDRNLFYFF